MACGGYAMNAISGLPNSVLLAAAIGFLLIMVGTFAALYMRHATRDSESKVTVSITHLGATIKFTVSGNPEQLRRRAPDIFAKEFDEMQTKNRRAITPPDETPYI
jgi:hypothetical protein